MSEPQQEGGEKLRQRSLLNLTPDEWHAMLVRAMEERDLAELGAENARQTLKQANRALQAAKEAVEELIDPCVMPHVRQSKQGRKGKG